MGPLRPVPGSGPETSVRMYQPGRRAARKKGVRPGTGGEGGVRPGVGGRHRLSSPCPPWRGASGIRWAGYSAVLGIGGGSQTKRNKRERGGIFLDRLPGPGQITGQTGPIPQGRCDRNGEVAEYPWPNPPLRWTGRAQRRRAGPGACWCGLQLGSAFSALGWITVNAVRRSLKPSSNARSPVANTFSPEILAPHEGRESESGQCPST
jgi:hypothetical protein